MIDADRDGISSAELLAGPLARFLDAEPALEIGAGEAGLLPADQALVFAGYRLQEIRDYRAAIRAWFGAVRTGGHLVIVVPHAFLRDRRSAPPSPWSAHQLRVYTPRVLLDEVEEALVPNSYRVRWAGDCDAGYDYGLEPDRAPVGEHHAAVVLERIAPPGWSIELAAQGDPAGPPFAFEPPRTRVERATPLPAMRILALKLDHLGDFVMGIPALERLRAAFPAAEITLVVGSWNADMAAELACSTRSSPSTHIRAIRARRSPIRAAGAALFDATVTGDYDLAIDLRNDADTRFFLMNVRTRLRAGMGTRAAFPFLDIFLPADVTRHEHEAVEIVTLAADAFSHQDCCARSRYHLACDGARANDASAIVWGPYRWLRAGRYIFEPFFDLDRDRAGAVLYDIALSGHSVVQGLLPEGGALSLPFDCPADGTKFEFRLWMHAGDPVRDFHFFGGRLIRQGASSVLHQSEYLTLLVELVAMRVRGQGVLRDGERIA